MSPLITLYEQLRFFVSKIGYRIDLYGGAEPFRIQSKKTPTPTPTPATILMSSDTNEQHECKSLKTFELSQFQYQKQEDENNSVLTIKLPSPMEEFNNGVDEDDEPTTPTSSDQKIPATTSCPPAPRKPKSLPMGNKRKSRDFQRISVDLMVMINAMLVQPAVITSVDILAGRDLGAGERAKKVKKANVTFFS
ncbi:hypothetical protein R6Q57_002506 [Mikania cordata]